DRRPRLGVGECLQESADVPQPAIACRHCIRHASAENEIRSRPGCRHGKGRRRSTALPQNPASYSTPSLALRMSLTTCGLALPPLCFMTCPTNQPMVLGLVLTVSTWSGLA